VARVSWEVPASEPDPPLHEEGLARAEKWAEVLRYADIDAVFSTDRRRKIQSAEPLAKLLGLEVVQFPKYEVEASAERMIWVNRSLAPGRAVLIVSARR
jgi:broad specificity phosphatase PhoE